jgi:XisI protein
MVGLKEILLPVLESYAGVGLNGSSEMTQDVDCSLFIIVATGYRKEVRFVFTALIVRILGDKIIIEEDRNSDPLYQALVDAGIPRENIVLAYAGEAVPDAA